MTPGLGENISPWEVKTYLAPLHREPIPAVSSAFPGCRMPCRIEEECAPTNWVMGRTQSGGMESWHLQAGEEGRRFSPVPPGDVLFHPGP